MKRFIFLSFGFLGLAFYELSGGSDFDPIAARNEAVLARSGVDLGADSTGDSARQLAQAQAAPEVTQVSLNLTSLGDVLDRKADLTEAPLQVIAPAAEVASVTPVTFSGNDEAVIPSLIFPGRTSTASPSELGQRQDVRSVAADRANMRGGPGTRFDVVTQLERNTRVEVLQDDGSGWVKLRPADGGPEGWIADFLLTGG